MTKRGKIAWPLMLLFILTVINGIAQAQIYSGKDGKVKFKGIAPNETITGESATLAGKLDVSTNKFNFRQPLNSFAFSQGNLQKKDAEESYWEVDKFPNASFSGKIINDVNLAKDGVYKVTAQGTFSMHGVEKEMKIPVEITVKKGVANVNSQFSIYLSDFNIKIPRLVSLKVSEEFMVDLAIVMQ